MRVQMELFKVHIPHSNFLSKIKNLRQITDLWNDCDQQLRKSNIYENNGIFIFHLLENWRTLYALCK